MEIEIANPYILNFVFTNSYSKEIPILSSDVSYNYFFSEFINQNKACLIRNISSQWNCSKLWHRNGVINFDYLNSEFGNGDVMLYNCRERYFNSQKTKDAKFIDFLQYWKSYIDKKYDASLPLYYLKDWHLKKIFPENHFYEVPQYFVSDWINEYLIDTSDDDYRFVYMGPKGSWTPFHADVFSSFSWSANICGKKRWILFPEGVEKKLRDSFGNLPYDVGELQDDTHYYEIIQNPGDAVFVPSGWYHQVWNLEDTISVNHNWVNGSNIQRMWVSLEKSLNDVRDEIKDCSDMDDYSQHCQVMLRAYFGIDFLKFYKFLLHIAQKRIDFIQNKVPVILFEKYNLGNNHAIFDLIAIKKTLKLSIKNTDFMEAIQKNSIGKCPTVLLEKIQNTIGNNTD